MYWLASRRARVLRACRRLQCRHHPAQVHPVLRHRQQRDLLVVSLLPILRLLGLLLPLLRHRVLEPRVAPLHRVLRAGAVRLLPLARHLGRETRVRPVQAAFRPEVRIYLVVSLSPGSRLQQVSIPRSILTVRDPKLVLRHVRPEGKMVTAPAETRPQET